MKNNLRLSSLVNTTISHPLFSGSFIMLIGSNSVNFLNFLYQFIMVRILSPADYGELVALISVMGLLAIIPSSFSLVVIKYVSSTTSNKGIGTLAIWLKKKILQISLIFFIIVIIASPTISSFLHINKLIYFFLIAVSFLFSLQSLLNRSILQGMLKFKEMIISILLENGAKLLLSFLLVYLGFYVGGVMFALALATLLGWYITNIYLKYPKREKNNTLPDIKPMLLFTIPVMIQSLAITSLYSSDVILVKHFFPSHDAGVYGALSTLGKIIFFGSGPIGSVMFPLVSKRQSQGLEYKRIFLYSFIATAIFAIVMLLVYWLIPNFVINLLYGSTYLEAANLLIWFGIFISFFTFDSLVISYQLSLGRGKVVVLPFIAALIQITLIWFFHQTLFMVIFISIIVTALLLIALLVYSSFRKINSYEDKFNIGNSSSL